MKKKAGQEATEEDIKDQDLEDTETDVEESDDASDEEDTKDSAEDEESESGESEEESEDEDKSSSDKNEDLDLDAELEKERKAGEPDPEAAGEAFRKRKKKREEDSEEGEDESDNKPLTQKDLADALARDRKERQQDDALIIAREMAGSEKEAELIVAKWNNRTYPKTLTLRQQVSEAYVITHSKKLLGERDEALRALRGRRSIRNDGSGTHHDGKKNLNAPKLPPGTQKVLNESGFKLNPTTKRIEKKLSSGRTLFRDPRTNQVRLLPKGQ